MWNSNNVSTESWALAYIWPGCSALYPWLGSPHLFPEFLSCFFSPQSPCGQSQEAGIRDLFSHLYSQLFILFMSLEKSELCSSPTIWGAAQESGNIHFLGKLASGKILDLRTVGQGKQEISSIWCSYPPLVTWLGIKRFCSQKEFNFEILINMDSKAFLNPGSKPASPAFAGGFLTTEPQGKPHIYITNMCVYLLHRHLHYT